MPRACAVASLLLFLLGCRSPGPTHGGEPYQSATLALHRVSPHAYQHTSFLETTSFGRVACNGLIVVDGAEAVVFDTPATEAATVELLDYLEYGLNVRVKAVVPTHFHADCLAGLAEFHRRRIPSYALQATLALAAGNQATVPQHGFAERLALRVGRREVLAHFLGEGHTKDNVVAYFAAEQVLLLCRRAGAFWRVPHQGAGGGQGLPGRCQRQGLARDRCEAPTHVPPYPGAYPWAWQSRGIGIK